jgi:hypothetical protein
MLRLRVQDATAGFRAYRADVFGQIDIGSVRTEDYGFQVEMTHRVMEAGGSQTCEQHEIPATDAGRLYDVQSSPPPPLRLQMNTVTTRP